MKSNDKSKKKTREVERISAAGLVVVLEFLAGQWLSQQGSKKSHGAMDQAVMFTVDGRTGKVGNLSGDTLPALLFALTHPWVEIHQPDGLSHCGNSSGTHEREYEHMGQLSHALLDARDVLYSQNDDDEDED